MSYAHYILLPLLGALIGWSTNWLAIRMLFRPRLPVRLFGLRLQGMIPRRQIELAERVGAVVERELFNHHDIRRALSDPTFLNDCEQKIYKHVCRFTTEKLDGMPKLLRRTLNNTGVTFRFERALADDIARRLPDIIDDASAALEDSTDIRAIIREKIAELEIERVEKIVLDVASRELKLIELAGGALGFIIGLLQVALLSLF